MLAKAVDKANGLRRGSNVHMVADVEGDRFLALRNYSYLCHDENENRNIAGCIADDWPHAGANACRLNGGGAGSG